MSTELMSASDIARDFLIKSGYVFFQLHKANFDTNTNQWRLTYDVGLSVQKLRTVVIDGPSGKVVAFE